MRQIRRQLCTIVAVVGLGTASSLAATAQEATPPSVIDIAPGVTADQVVIFEGRDDPSLYRLHFDPGTSYTIEPSQSLELVYAEQGSLVVILDAPTVVGVAVAGSTAPSLTAANTEFTLQPGQYFVLAPTVGGSVRNDSQETVTLSIAGVLPAPSSTPAA